MINRFKESATEKIGSPLTEDFGWVNQKEAFENILNIVNEVKMKYHLEHSKIYLCGMSNGGSATFWFASQKPNIFNGFFAISAFPKLNFSEINFDNISQNKPFIMLSDLNDKLYNPTNYVCKGFQGKTP